MRMKEAIEIIEGKSGFVVRFSEAIRGGLKTDFFPDTDAGEMPIPYAEEAWSLAGMFAKRTVGRFFDIYVAGVDFKPGEGADRRTMNKRG